MGATSSKSFSYVYLKYKTSRVSYRESTRLREEGKGSLATSPPVLLVLRPHSGTAGGSIAGYVLFPTSQTPGVEQSKACLERRVLTQ